MASFSIFHKLSNVLNLHLAKLSSLDYNCFSGLPFRLFEKYFAYKSPINIFIEFGHFNGKISNPFFFSITVLKNDVVQGWASDLLVQILYIAQLFENALTPSLSEIRKFSDPGPYYKARQREKFPFWRFISFLFSSSWHRQIGYSSFCGSLKLCL